MSKKKKLKIAVVWWNDAAYRDDTMNMGQVESFCGCDQITVGHVAHEDEDYIRLALETSETWEDWWKHVITIPKAWIVKRKIIRV